MLAVIYLKSIHFFSLSDFIFFQSSFGLIGKIEGKVQGFPTQCLPAYTHTSPSHGKFVRANDPPLTCHYHLNSTLYQGALLVWYTL